MKIPIVFALIIVLTSCHRDKICENSIIYEGVGVDQLTLDKADEKAVKEFLNTEFNTIYRRGYSVEIFYKKYGLSFFYLMADNSRKIFAISCNTNFKGKTKKGFLISKMNVADMVRIYGEPRWQYLTDPDILNAHYDSTGIYFSIVPRKEIEAVADTLSFVESDEESEEVDSINNRMLWRFYDSAYAKDKIIEMVIGIPRESF
ncbi:MAG TPA: hypothetical protein VGQ09_04065 [Chitinophagaceae bacterium]|jgi:hypothetical protein|nr:hypothetical protein [Chitinophagaceae bacterium]